VVIKVYNLVRAHPMLQWISVEEAAELSGYNAEHVRRLIRSKLIVAQKKGAMWWVDQLSLMAYCNAAAKSSDRRRGPKSD
jgi:hypothetical protein